MFYGVLCSSAGEYVLVGQTGNCVFLEMFHPPPLQRELRLYRGLVWTNFMLVWTIIKHVSVGGFI